MGRPWGAGTLAIVVALFAGASTAAAAAPLQASGGRFVDAAGRTVILRGINVNGLGDYYQARADVPSNTPLKRADFDRIAALGLNSVRLLVTWSRLEPQPGVHNEAYLAEIRQAVGWARDAGLKVVLDMHQDAWGKYIATKPGEQCPLLLSPSIGWDGAPEWATKTHGQSTCHIAVRELAPAVLAAWQAFWDNEAGIRDRFVATWGWLAGSFADDPAVVGYDILNEPGWGEDYSRNLYGGRAAMYRGALAAIRAAERPDAHKLVFFEPFSLWSAWPSEVTYRWTDDANVVYAPHIYVGSITLDTVVFGKETVPLRSGFDNARTEAAYLGRTPVWVGEWGWFGGESTYWNRFAALEDEYQFSSAMWQYRQACGDPHGFGGSPTGTPPTTSNGLVLLRCGDAAQPAGVETGLNTQAAAMLGRPYPRAYPGTATFTADVAARRLTVNGSAAAGTQPLEVWVPGAARPTLTTTGLQALSRTRVSGGWIVRGTPKGGVYALTTAGG